MNTQVTNNLLEDKRLSLRINFGWTFLGNLVNAACLWGIVAVLAKLGDPATVGRLELGRTIALPVLAITTLQLRVVHVTDALGKYSFEDYYGARLITAIVGFVIIAAIGFIFYSGENMCVVILWGVAKSIDTLSDIMRGLFQKHERMDFSGISFIHAIE